MFEKPSDKIMELLGLDKEARIKEHLESYIIPLLKAGFSFEEIAQSYEVKGETLRRWFIAYNLDLYKETMDTVKKARKCLDEGIVCDIKKDNREEISKIIREPLTIQERCQIEKIFGDRHSMMDGDPTGHMQLSSSGLTIIIGEKPPDD